MHQGGLQRLKELQRARQQAGTSGRCSHLAFASDLDNDAYMRNFEQAFSNLSAEQPGALQALQADQQQGRPSASKQKTAGCRQHLEQVTEANGTPAVKQIRSTTVDNAEHNRRRPSCTCDPQSQGRPASTASALFTSSQQPNADDSAVVASCVLNKRVQAAATAPGWRTGPIDPAGELIPLSDRPIMCSAAFWQSDEVVVGSSDHALYVVDVQSAKKIRTLYSKACGHTEWVTCVCYLPQGRILSGGMDGRIWVWPAAGSSGRELMSAHAGPVSKLASLTPVTSTTEPASRVAGSRNRAPASAVHAGPHVAVSCSYDKTVKLWDVGSNRARMMAVLLGHAGSVLEMDVKQGGNSIATGECKGSLICWDVTSHSRSWSMTAAHQGHVTALTWHHSATRFEPTPSGTAANTSDCVLSGGQDGCVRVWDGRTGACVAEQVVHVDKRGKGAVGSIVANCGLKGDQVVTCGADMTLQVLDAAKSYRPMHKVQLTDFPYSLTVVGGLAVCGCGDGSVHVVDIDTGSTLYALHPGKAAIRAVEASEGCLMCSGDDGIVSIHRFQ